MAYAIITIKKFNQSSLAPVLKHNFREHENTEEANQNIDWNRTKDNWQDIGYDEIRKRIKEEVKPLVKRADYVQVMGFVTTASPSFFDGKNEQQIKEWANHSIDFLKEKYGDNYLGSVVHMDEKTPHIHSMIKPIVNGKLNAKKLTLRPELINLQNEYHQHMECFGLQRGIKQKERVNAKEAKEYAFLMNQDIAEFNQKEATAIKEFNHQMKGLERGIEKLLNDNLVKPLIGDEIIPAKNIPSLKEGIHQLIKDKKMENGLYRQLYTAYSDNKEIQNKANEAQAENKEMIKQLQEMEKQLKNKNADFEDIQQRYSLILEKAKDLESAKILASENLYVGARAGIAYAQNPKKNLNEHIKDAMAEHGRNGFKKIVDAIISLETTLMKRYELFKQHQKGLER